MGKKKTCPLCGHNVNDSTYVETSDLHGIEFKVDSKIRPHPGDYTVCAYCGAICLFKKNMSLKPMSTVEFLLKNGLSQFTKSVLWVHKAVIQQAAEGIYERTLEADKERIRGILQRVK